MAASKKGRELDEGEVLKIRVTFTDDILGTNPASPEVYKDYIASRSPDAKSIEEELEHVSVEEYIASQLTIFMRDPETGVHELHHHMIKGFFKNACKALREKPKSVSSGIAAYKTLRLIILSLLSLRSSNSQTTIPKRYTYLKDL